MTWTVTDLQSLIASLRTRRGDSTLVEVKRASGGVPINTAETVCAFANMPDGGTLILGIDERADFALTGIADPASAEAAVVHQARSTITPAPTLTTSTLDIDGVPLVIVEVSPLPLVDRPAMFQGRAYLRQADGDYVMHEHELRMIEVEKLLMVEPRNYDSHPVPGLTREDLVPELVEEYLRQARLRDRRLAERGDDEILRRTGIITASGEPTLAGLYALGDYPQGVFPSLTVTTAVQTRDDTGQVRNRDLQHFTGPLPLLLDEVLGWCSRNIPRSRSYRPDGHVFERPELPLTAVRELVANALVHRDLGPNTLGAGKSIQIRLTPDALFVQSPGGLRGVSLQQLESDDHAQAAVNQRLYSIAQKLVTPDGFPLIEGEGGGIREVFRAADEFELPAPTLINTGVQFKALLWLPDAIPARGRLHVSRHKRRQEVVTTPATEDIRTGASQKPAVSKNLPAILSALESNGPASFADLQRGTGLTRGQLRYALSAGIEAGQVQMVGKHGDRTTVYQLAQQ